VAADPELQRRDALIDALRTHVERVGVAALTMESAAGAAGISVAELSEYFDSKEDLVVALIARNRIRLRERFAQLQRQAIAERADLRRVMWDFYLETVDDSRLFFEAYGLALHDERYRAFATGVDDWITLLTAAAEERGLPRQRAAALATLTLAVYRGAMLDFCATGDRARVSAAMELWFALERGTSTADDT
jgi:AcrR family transcriptional regulator